MTDELNVIKCRVALVTGGSRGIGRAIALALARAGADVAINCRERIEEGEAVARAIRSSGRRALVVPADVSVRQSVEEMVARISRELGPADPESWECITTPRRRGWRV